MGTDSNGCADVCRGSMNHSSERSGESIIFQPRIADSRKKMDIKEETKELLFFPRPTEQFELDFDKIKTLEDCVLVLKNIMMCSEFSKVYVNNTCADHENLKHLAKDDSIKKV